MKKRIIVISSVCVAVVLCLGYLFIPMEQKIIAKFRGRYNATGIIGYRSDYSSESKNQNLTFFDCKVEDITIELSKKAYSVTIPTRFSYDENADLIRNDTLTEAYAIIDYGVILADDEYLRNSNSVAADFINSSSVSSNIKSCYIIEISRYNDKNEIHKEYLIQLNDKIYATRGAVIVEVERG